ncbi:diguanylate cyclase (GGDEF)-like protein [Gellertiella hungarica]|uniref:diguanylate cyclase n=2 Tax=Gellertiella hungarica TaxID=1572859 RepID=A0A7W6J830_9HYPH|nr:diguanylate cyclase (GGDEF)-like protein [Gellertiella hungarica]
MDTMESTLQTLQLLEVSGALVAAYDADDRLRYANRAFRDAFFVEEAEALLWSELMRRNYHADRGTIVKTGDFECWLRSTSARRGKTGFRAFETDLHDGRWLWMTETMRADGWMICIATDVTSIRPDERTLRQDRDQALKASQTDELTGLPSRRFVMSKLEELLGDGIGAAGGVTCLAVLDIDHFKLVNDRFGHSVGDIVLRDFAAIIQNFVRKVDIVGRIGGEEFILILPNTTPEETRAILERMLRAVRQSRPLADPADFGYTFSAGIARAAPGDDTNTLFRRADLALYAAKLRGRDQIQMDGEAAPIKRMTF